MHFMRINSPSPCLLRKPSLSHVNGERDKTRVFLPFSPLAWEKGSGDEGLKVNNTL